MIACLLSTACGLVACASTFIEVRSGSERVSVTGAAAVAPCQNKGSVAVSVLSHVGFISRDGKDVADNLQQLARNAAVDAGADTVVQTDFDGFGKAVFSLYRCRP